MFKTIAATAALAVVLALGAAAPSYAASAPVQAPLVSGVATCTSAGTISVAWSTNGFGHAYQLGFPTVIAPTASSISYSAWLHGHPTSFVQSGISGAAPVASVSVPFNFSDGTFYQATGTVSLSGCVAAAAIHKSFKHFRR